MIRSALFIAICHLVLQQSFALSMEDQFSITLSCTYGKCGPPKPTVFTAGEVIDLFVTFKGIKFGPDREFRCDVALDIYNSSKEIVSEAAVSDSRSKLALGGNTANMLAPHVIPKSCAPGKYELHFSAIDLNSKKKARAILPFEVLPENTFTLRNLRFARDPKGECHAGSCFNVTDGIFVLFSVIGASEEDNKWKLTSRLQILDKNKKPLSEGTTSTNSDLFTPFTGELPISTSLDINQAGAYYMQIDLIDRVSKKQITRILPFVVINAPYTPSE